MVKEFVRDIFWFGIEKSHKIYSTKAEIVKKQKEKHADTIYKLFKKPKMGIKREKYKTLEVCLFRSEVKLTNCSVYLKA